MADSAKSTQKPASTSNPPLPPLKWVFPCTGHSGSKYVAALMTAAGHPCGHETVAMGDVKGTVFNKAPAVRAQAESSAFVAPALHVPPFKDTRQVHITRDPIKVIRSWRYSACGLGYHTFFTAHMEHLKLWAYEEIVPLHIQTDPSPPADPPRDMNWLVAMYLTWTRFIDNQVSERLKVELGPGILEALGIPVPSDVPPTNTNQKIAQFYKDPEWDQVHLMLRDELAAKREEYGYA